MRLTPSLSRCVSASAKPCNSLGRKCAYTSSSSCGERQPPIFCAQSRFVPRLRCSDAKVCRSACGVILRPVFPSARRTSGSKTRLRKFVGSMSVPASLGNTSVSSP